MVLRRLLGPVTAVAAITALALVATPGAGAQGPAEETVFAGFGPEGRGAVLVGKLPGTRAYVGVHVRGRRVRIYICDGDSRRISIDEWFSGRLASNRTVSGLRSRLNALTQQGTATLGGSLSANRRSFRGAVTLRNGRTIRFTARRARGSALFVYRLVDGNFKTGLVQLPDGSDRGTSYPPYIRGGELHSEER